jgi:CBS domain-containing protein
MNRELVTVQCATPVPDAARLMWEHDRTTLPVVDASGVLVGLVTESDLLVRLQSRRRAWWRALLDDPDERVRAYRKRAGTTVADILRAVPAPLGPEMPIQAAAELLAGEVREVPVVAHGRLVGTVSRTDLLQVLPLTAAGSGGARPDPDLVQAMRTRLADEDWVSSRGLGVEASHGVLRLSGLVETEAEKAALGMMARTIPGCTGVENGLVPMSQLRSHWV